MKIKEHLIRLCEAHGPSGYEGPVRDLILEDWTDLTDELRTDALGNLIGTKRGRATGENRRRIMIEAHMDEIGMLVREIDGAFLRVRNLGGLDSRVMLSQPVLVQGKKPLPGVVAAAPPHLLNADERKRFPSVDELIIDVGLSAEEVAELVCIGDPVTLDVPVQELVGDVLVGKAMDDRACVATLTACLQELQGRDHLWDVLAVAAVQEEVGLRGARVAAQGLNPDVAIALDVTFAMQNGVGESDYAYKMGSGLALSLGTNFHPKLYEALKQTADDLEMTLNIDPLPGRSGTDAWAIQIAQQGIPTALISIPLRNMHTPVEMLDFKDVQRAGRLLAAFIAGLEEDFLATIVWDSPLSESPAEDEEADA